MLKASCLGLAVLLGLALAANGIFMLVSPEHWYVAVPGVTSTGPFNQHFLRDIGLIFVFLGGAFLLGTARPQFRVLLWGAAAIWLLGHALFHFWEVAVGICSPSDLVRDFPAVTLPAIIATVLTLWALWYAAPKKAASPLQLDTREPRVRNPRAFCWSMIFSENRYPLFGIMLFCWSMIVSENRYPLFGIML